MSKELTPDEVKKINELLAPGGWTVGQIYRARRDQVFKLCDEIDRTADAVYKKLHYPDEPGYVENDPEYKAVLAKHNALINEP